MYDCFVSVCPYICMSICLHVHMSACPYVCMSICMYVCMYICLYVHMCVCPYVCMSICLCVLVSICLYVCIPVCPYVHVFIYVYSLSTCTSVFMSVCLYDSPSFLLSCVCLMLYFLSPKTSKVFYVLNSDYKFSPGDINGGRGEIK